MMTPIRNFTPTSSGYPVGGVNVLFGQMIMVVLEKDCQYVESVHFKTDTKSIAFEDG